MPTITKEAEKALMEVSRQKSDTIADLRRRLDRIYSLAGQSIDDGKKHGAVYWRDALEAIQSIAK